MDFVHLHLHSEYSLLDGACRIGEIPRRARALGQTAAAVTDHGVMYGAVEFFRACEKEQIKPIIGCEIYLAPESRFGRQKADLDYSHFLLLCKNETGYRNLIAIVSAAYTEGFYAKPRADLELLAAHADGLCALSACISGIIPKCILAGDLEAASAHAKRFEAMFGRGNFYLELQDHGIPAQKTVNAGLKMIASQTGIPLVATNDVHYLERADSEAQKALMCIQTNTVMDGTSEVGFPTDEFYMKSAEEMASLFGDTPEALENTVKIAEMCTFAFDFSHLFLPAFPTPDGLTPQDYLKKLTDEGLKMRLAQAKEAGETPDREKYRERIDYELSVICKMGYAEYYLIVRDFIRYAKDHGIPVGPGRGSGAGSLAAYCLGITDVDSIKYNLLFERFLNPERVSMPDFDVDFSDERRGEVIEYVAAKYGADHVSQIVTFGTLKARAVIRDVGRVLGFSYAETDEVARLVPRALDMTIDFALAHVPELERMYREDYRKKKLIDLARALEGMPRHASMHAAGVVITDQPVSHYVPLSVNHDTVVTQYTMNDIADLGLLKIDFLGLKYLSIIERAEREICRKNKDFSAARAPLDDKKTYALLCEGATEGIFQLESAGMRSLLQRMRPASIEDITAAISLYRPGPMDSIPKFIENRLHPEKIRYADERLRPILSVTNGCIVYQEQVMQICRVLAGYSYGAADIVRRAMAKKKTDVMEKERSIFVDGAVKNGVERASAEAIFDDMADFAKYAFNKSHAASYALLAYRTAYLKAHYPKEYLAAILSVYIDSEEKLNLYIAECKRSGVGVLPPDINRSDGDFTVEGDDVRFGFYAIKNVGGALVGSLVAEREKNGPFRSFEDFLLRMPEINRRMLESLIKCGVFDSFGKRRSQLLSVFESALDTVSKRSRRQISGQIDLFSLEASPGDGKMPENQSELALTIDYPPLEEFTPKELLLMEKETAGIYLSGHPVLDYSGEKARLSACDIGEICASFGEEGSGAFRERERVTVLGIITSKKLKITKNETRMAFLELEDTTGSIEVIVFPGNYEPIASSLSEENVVAVSGEISLGETADGEQTREEPKLILRALLPIVPDGTAAPEPEPKPKSKPKPNKETEAADADDPRFAGMPADAANGASGTANESDLDAFLGGTEKTAPAGGTERGIDCLYLKIPSENAPAFARIKALLELFAGGDMPVYVYFEDRGALTRASGLRVAMNETFYRLLCEILGDGGVAVRARKNGG